LMVYVPQLGHKAPWRRNLSVSCGAQPNQHAGCQPNKQMAFPALCVAGRVCSGCKCHGHPCCLPRTPRGLPGSGGLQV